MTYANLKAAHIEAKKRNEELNDESEIQSVPISFLFAKVGLAVRLQDFIDLVLHRLDNAINVQ